MNLNFLKSKKTKQNEAKASLKTKIQKIVNDLSWTKNPYETQKIVDFFNYLEDAFAGITQKENEVAHQYIRNVMRTTARNSSGWFRAPKGHKATIDNTFIQPTGHMDEFFNTKTVRELMSCEDTPCNHFGFAARPMDTKEFYYEAFVKVFIDNKVAALEGSLQEF